MHRPEKGKDGLPRYRSYLLRLWQVDDDEQPLWRASLKSSRTGEEVGFASLEEMFEYLRAETGLGDGAET